jgi:hypothetical protein
MIFLSTLELYQTPLVSSLGACRWPGQINLHLDEAQTLSGSTHSEFPTAPVRVAFGNASFSSLALSNRPSRPGNLTEPKTSLQSAPRPAWNQPRCRSRTTNLDRRRRPFAPHIRFDEQRRSRDDPAMLRLLKDGRTAKSMSFLFRHPFRAQRRSPTESDGHDPLTPSRFSFRSDPIRSDQGT